MMSRRRAAALTLGAALTAAVPPMACAGTNPASAPQSAPVRLASDDWCPYVCAQHGEVRGGALVELAERALALSGWRVEARLLPLKRAIADAARGALEGVYAPPIDARLAQSVPLMHSRACFYTRADASWRYAGMASLAGRRIGIIADYGYDDGPFDALAARPAKNGPELEHAYGITAGKVNLQKLLNTRFDTVLEHEAVMGALAAREQATLAIRQAGCLEQALPLTIGFARSDARSPSWLAAIADGMRKLEASGEARALRQRYGLP